MSDGAPQRAGELGKEKINADRVLMTHFKRFLLPVQLSDRAICLGCTCRSDVIGGGCGRKIVCAATSAASGVKCERCMGRGGGKRFKSHTRVKMDTPVRMQKTRANRP
jgi:hypothetical protein